MTRLFRAPAPLSRPPLARAPRPRPSSPRPSSARPASLLAAMATLAGALGAPLAASAEGTLTAFTSGYRSLNPGVQSGAATGVPGSQIFAGLVLIGADYGAEPYLATGWEVSEDGLTYTFRLVEGATFHDGAPITSADVAFSLDVVKANHPFGPAMFGKVETVETPDDLTAVFKLSEPAPGLLLSLQPLLMPILPRHVYGDGQEVKKHPRNMTDVVGSGPFKVEENNPAEKLILVKNEDFFIEGRPKLDRIVFPLVKDGLTRMLMVEKGEIDYAPFSGAKPTDAERLEEAGGVTVSKDGYGAVGYIHYLEMNLREGPFADVKVRQALAMALDTGFVARVLFGGRAEVGTGPLHTGNPFYTADVPRLEPDMEKAAAMLDEAGYPAGSGGARFGFTLDVPSWALQSHGPMAEYIRAQLGKLGVSVELRRAPDFGTWVSRISSFDYEATLNGSFNYPDPVIGVHRHFDCDNIRNVIWSNTQGYCDPAMDALLDAAAVEQDFDVRKGIYAEIQQKAVADQVFIWMPEEFTTTILGARVEGAPDGAFGPLAPWDEMTVSAE